MRADSSSTVCHLAFAIFPYIRHDGHSPPAWGPSVVVWLVLISKLGKDVAPSPIAVQFWTMSAHLGYGSTEWRVHGTGTKPRPDRAERLFLNAVRSSFFRYGTSLRFREHPIPILTIWRAVRLHMMDRKRTSRAVTSMGLDPIPR